MTPFEKAVAQTLHEVAKGADTTSEAGYVHFIRRVLSTMSPEECPPEIMKAYREAQQRFVPALEDQQAA